MKRKSYPLQIRFNDLDLYGHVNNAMYLTYFEEGRMLYFQDLVGTEWDWKKHGIIVARHEIDYKLPLTLGDESKIALWVSHIGRKSLEITYEIRKKNAGEWTTCTTGKTVLVCIDYETKQTVPVPEEWVSILTVENEKN